MTYTKSLFWFRRDLRHFDNAALYQALKQSRSCYCVFIFDTTILQALPKQDRRVQFIHQSVQELRDELKKIGTHLITLHSDPALEIPRLAAKLGVNAVFANRDYEPTAIARDQQVRQQLSQFQCDFIDYKDQVIFEQDEVLSQAGKPFSVFTPYKNAWLKKLASETEGRADFYFQSYPVAKYVDNFAEHVESPFPSLAELGFEELDQDALKLQGGMCAGAALLDDFLTRIDRYGHARDFPAIKGPSFTLRYSFNPIFSKPSNAAHSNGERQRRCQRLAIRTDLARLLFYDFVSQSTRSRKFIQARIRCDSMGKRKRSEALI
jgi:deoxyribodipyrimidine photo-lyase